jgi:uncharacterized protein (TIGR04222 family)
MVGRSFLMLYAGSFATLLLATALVWRRCQPAVDSSIDAHSLDVTDLAALTGGGQRAAIAAMATLRRRQVRTGPSGTMLAEGPLDEHAGELERELYEAVRGSPGAPAKSLVDAAARGPAATRILARLKAAGLLLDARGVACMHVLWACGAVLFGAGLVGLLDSFEHKIVPVLVSPLGVMVASAAALWWWIHRHRCGASAEGRRLVGEIGDAGEGLRGRCEHIAFDVAMFGSVVLWEQDWPLASALGIPSLDEEHASGAWAMLDFLFGGGEGCGCGCG